MSLRYAGEHQDTTAAFVVPQAAAGRTRGAEEPRALLRGVGTKRLRVGDIGHVVEQHQDAS
jgi:hypothetical protein